MSIAFVSLSSEILDWKLHCFYVQLHLRNI